MFDRHLDTTINTHFAKYREALVLLGARQVGKTTLLKRLFPQAQYLNVDQDPIKNLLDKYDPATYQQLLKKDQEYVIIDEVQRLADPGRAVKIIYDQLPEHKLIITGSSAFNIKNKTSESLAGRKIDYHLYPLTTSEYLTQEGIEADLSTDLLKKMLTQSRGAEIIKPYNYQAILNNLLIYGQYPGILSHQRDSIYLTNLVDSVIFRDLTELALIDNKAVALSLLRLLAHQIGSLVNYAELSRRLGVDVKTIRRYIELFEASFIIFRLSPYSTNQRDEIGKMPKIYFFDLGLRNALVENFSEAQSRGDLGQLFENYVILELWKYNQYGNYGYHFNYWRTKSGSETDLVLSLQKDLFAVEIKSSSRRVSQAFAARYPHAQSRVISPANFWPTT